MAALSRLSPAPILADCRVEPINGLTGQSFRIRTGGGDWLARAVSAEKTLLGADGRREYRILRHVSSSGLAPRPALLTPRWSLVEWVAGDTPTAEQWRRVWTDGALARRLRQLHRLPRSGYPLALQARFVRYWQATDPARHNPAWLRLHRRLLHCRTPASLQMALLHMDLHAANVVQPLDGALCFIDWEYASDGDIALELAALFSGNAVDESGQAAFLAAYLGGSGGYPLAVLQRHIAAWRPWADYLMLLWHEARWRQTGCETYLIQGMPFRRALALPG
ncbi:phosphotransferase [Martelella alba]|uniref:Choline kinase n=1 Tax=Martelella alba TaxID=2590451 RepID=A0ABY2SPV6_9HYPH|nr:phosphotransferase [Martelella alba]TKI07712.1 choline kinase [Martelella alba]